MYLLDQTWLPFANLMLQRVYNVLLICSDYDRFMLEEDGRVEEELYKEYTALGLSNPPKITHTNSEEEALSLIKVLNFQLVITMLDLGSDRVEALAEEIKKIKPDMPVIALSPSPDHRKARALKGENCPYIDYLFYWQGNPALFLAMVKLVEDRMNLDHDTAEADVQVIILVEDSVRFTSTYLPQMYTELIRQNRISILEGLNEWGKTLRMRGRPKIVLARNYETAWSLYKKYKANVLGVITDMSFPSPYSKEESGFFLAEAIKKDNPECPVLIQSTDLKYKEEALKKGYDFIWKLSDNMLMELERYFIKEYNFGPFNFINPKTGETISSVSTMKEVQNTLKDLPLDSFIYHSTRNDFSRWFRSQSLYQLASIIKPIKLCGPESAEKTRDLLYKTIKNYRAERTRGSIAEFSKNSYDETLFFARMGKGSLGGKGRGLAFIAMEMKANRIQEKYPDVYLSIPRTVVISTEFFDSFMALNNLEDLYFTTKPDQEILKLFLNGKMPEELTENLKEVLNVIKVPISVRSSSLLEDSHFQPFAGVYQTSMIPNQGSDEKRLEDLEAAVKTVWASTYFEIAKEYLKRTGHSLEEEKMAVIIQQITGSLHGNMWFPNVSGVARSLNYYPTEGQKAEDGVGHLAFGLGKTIVDGGVSFRFCPGKPKKPSSSSSGEISEQQSFFALDISKPFVPLQDVDNLVSLPLEWASSYPRSLRGVASTLDMSSGMISESPNSEGIKMITFNGILKYDMYPLASIIHDVLKLGSESMAEPVEIEIAFNTERQGEKKPDFSILQVRPISNKAEFVDLPITQEDKRRALVYSCKVMGNGEVLDIKDMICIKKNEFRASQMNEMAMELESLNKSTDSSYILLVAGRLGSSDPWLGIPVSFSQISNAHVIVETGLKEINVEPSEGTHFFQNMTSLGCIYLTVNPEAENGIIDWEGIYSLDIIHETKHFLHLRNNKPFIIKANGLKGEAVIGI